MHKIPLIHFYALSKNEEWEITSAKFSKSPVNIKAGSFSLVCPVDSDNVVKVSICPLFSEYLKNLSTVSTSFLKTKKKLKVGTNVFGVNAAILPKMEELKEEPYLVSKLNSFLKITSDLNILIHCLESARDFDEQALQTYIAVNILQEERKFWDARFRANVIRSNSSVYSAVVYATVSHLRDEAEIYQKYLNEVIQYNSVAKNSALAKRLKNAFRVYRWTQELHKELILQRIPEKEIKLLVSCLTACNKVKLENSSAKFDLHRRNIMRITKGPYKGCLFITDPFFDTDVLAAVRNASPESCQVLG